MFSPHIARQVKALSNVADGTWRAYLADPNSVREASRIRIERALAELGYTPGQSPSGFKGGLARGPFGITSVGWNGPR